MIVSFSRHGTGSAASAASYLLAERDHSGKPRDQVEVLRGDPEAVAEVADSLEFEHRYRSAVLAWAPEDQPTDAQIGRALDRFEEVAWAGVDPERYAWSAVLHRDEKSVHVHILTARCDLQTGKSFNIAPPGWERDFGALERSLNTEHSWARPDDPRRRRSTRPERFPGRRADIREALREHLEGAVVRGTVHDRESLVATLRDIGLDITRQGQHYVTVRDPKTTERWRLKGAMYDRDWTAAGERTTPRDDGPGRGASGTRGRRGRGVRGVPAPLCQRT